MGLEYQKQLEQIVARTLKDMLKDTNDDLKIYAKDIATSMGHYMDNVAIGNRKIAARYRRHLKAQAMNLRSITTSRESLKWTEVWWKILQMSIRVGVTALTTL